jgi:hypothetical protein
MPKTKRFPSDPLERCHVRWHALFFGVWKAIWRHDPNLTLGMLLALEKAGLAEYQGDVLTFVPRLFEQSPSGDILRKTFSFRHSASIPPLRGRIRSGRTRPYYFSILLEYYRALFEERLKLSPRRQRQARQGGKRVLFAPQGKESASERALEVVAEKTGYTVPTCRKYLEKAQKLYPDLTKLWSRKGAEWIRSS